MNEEHLRPQPTTKRVDTPASRSRRRRIGIGFALGTAVWLIPLVLRGSPNDGEIPSLIVAAFFLPVAAAILALVKETRPIGLGLLLACGIGWLIFGAICGGLIR
jgi:hypothetical protein